MSHRALHLAVRNQLRAAVLSGGLGYDQKTCEVMPDGQPPANCGKLFVAVHRGSRRNVNAAGTCLEDEYSFRVTVSLRAGVAPRDRQGISLTDLATSGLEDVSDAIRTCLWRKRDVVRAAANAILDAAAGTPVNGFVEPPVPGADSVRAVNDAWFGGKGDGDVVAGWVCEMEFIGAKRLQGEDAT